MNSCVLPLLRVAMHTDVVNNTNADTVVIAKIINWLEKAVIGLNLCPFAKAVHHKKQINFVLSNADMGDVPRALADLKTAITDLLAQPADQKDTSLLIFKHPKGFVDFLDFHALIQKSNAMLKKNQWLGVVQLAHFHPKYEFASHGNPNEDSSLRNRINQSPYPIIHILRESSVSKAVQSFPDAASILEKNNRMLHNLGHTGWHALWK